MMSDAPKPILNLDDVAFMEMGHGETFAAKLGQIGQRIGSTGVGCMLIVVEPGKRAFPFHNHHNIHEMFVILEGEGTYRVGGTEYPVRAGDVLAAPAGGPETAHQIINTGSTTLKYLGISDRPDTEVVEYPDSGKFGVGSRFDWSNPEAGGIRFVGRKGESLDYWDGEDG